MFESPIQVLQTQMQMEMEGEILKAVYKVGVNVDKEELLRALAYDRGQYDKGYQDGVNDVCNRIIGRLEALRAEHEEREKDARLVGLTSHADLNGIKAYIYDDAIEIVKEEGLN